MNKLNPLNFFYRLIKNKPTVPRWIIFVLDLAICSVSLLYAYLLRFNMDFERIKHSGILTSLLVVTGLNIIFFRVFRTYEGIIRLSSAQEGVRCVSAVFCSSLVLLGSIIISSIFEVEFHCSLLCIIHLFFYCFFLNIFLSHIDKRTVSQEPEGKTYGRKCNSIWKNRKWSAVKKCHRIHSRPSIQGYGICGWQRKVMGKIN